MILLLQMGLIPRSLLRLFSFVPIWRLKEYPTACCDWDSLFLSPSNFMKSLCLSPLNQSNISFLSFAILPSGCVKTTPSTNPFSLPASPCTLLAYRGISSLNHSLIVLKSLGYFPQDLYLKCSWQYVENGIQICS